MKFKSAIILARKAEKVNGGYPVYLKEEDCILGFDKDFPWDKMILANII
jgi:hypothetical protein